MFFSFASYDFEVTHFEIVLGFIVYMGFCYFSNIRIFSAVDQFDCEIKLNCSDFSKLSNKLA